MHINLKIQTPLPPQCSLTRIAAEESRTLISLTVCLGLWTLYVSCKRIALELLCVQLAAANGLDTFVSSIVFLSTCTDRDSAGTPSDNHGGGR